MAVFHYKAATPEGEVVEGEMDASSQAAVVERLQGLGYVPIRAVPQGEAGTSKRWSFADLRLRKRGVSQKQLLIMTQELATLLRARLPLDRALEVLIELAANPQIRQLLTRVREGVHGGQTLSAAMEAQGRVFPKIYLSMLRAGEVGGTVEVVLTRLAEYLESAQDLKETVSSALIYPLVLFAVAGVSVIFLLVYVVPQFEQMFEDAGKALPFATQIVIAVGNFVRHYGWFLFIGVLLIGVAIERQLAQPEKRYRWDHWLLRWPLIGDLVVKLEVARFSRMLGTLITNGVPLLSGLSIVKDTLNNQVLARSMDGVVDRLKHGQGLAEPLLEVPFFPRLAVHMVRVGEETGQLEEMLVQVAEVYDREVRSSIKRMLALLEPALILGLGVIVGAIIVSILVAILSVNELAV
ncbi:MAG: type II secretion system F family protein [Gammaproteobacteria bacterium]